MTENPGPNNLGGNTNSHPLFYRMMEGQIFEGEELEWLGEVLDYRRHQMELAEYYCAALGLEHRPPAEKFEQWEWKHSLYIAKHEGTAEESEVAIALLKRDDTIRSWVIQLFLFDSPLPGQGFDYSKTWSYVAAMLAESSMETEGIYEKLKELEQSLYLLNCLFRWLLIFL